MKLFTNITEKAALDPWFKVVDMLQQNWAVLVEQGHSVLAVFYDDCCGVFDQVSFKDKSSAEATLMNNGFRRFLLDAKVQELIALPIGKFHQRAHPNGMIYSSGRYMSFEQEPSLKRVRGQLQISRYEARRLGRDTVEILMAGYYFGKAGQEVSVDKELSAAKASTVTYGPQSDLALTASGNGNLVVDVRNMTSLEAVRSMRSKDLEPAVLNMASATSPGGGFLGGARAQEEYLARSSGLWACLSGNEMYRFHRETISAFYEDYVIYSPNVPIIRDDDGELLDFPESCSFLTSPAVHAINVKRFSPERIQEVPHVMKKRIQKVLAVAHSHGHSDLVLGAWGCGAFGNEGAQIARLFKEVLTIDFHGAFNNIVFAIADWSDDKRFIGPFEQTLC